MHIYAMCMIHIAVAHTTRFCVDSNRVRILYKACNMLTVSSVAQAFFGRHVSLTPARVEWERSPQKQRR